MNITDYSRFIRGLLGTLKKHLDVIYLGQKKGRAGTISSLKLLAGDHDFKHNPWAIVDKLQRDVPLTQDEQSECITAIIEDMDNERVNYIIMNDVWEGEETVGPVSQEGMDEMDSDDFVNVCRAMVDRAQEDRRRLLAGLVEPQ